MSKEYVVKPYVVRQKYYSESTYRNVAFFEDAASAIEKYKELKRLCLRDKVEVIDLQTNTVIAE